MIIFAKVCISIHYNDFITQNVQPAEFFGHNRIRLWRTAPMDNTPILLLKLLYTNELPPPKDTERC